MIPKIIHYCWFGEKNKPKSVMQYIEGWKVMLPDFNIVEWNEKNFDVNYNTYTKDAYKAKKYAFVSDVARLNALYKYGGIYLDTDIEIKQDFDDLLDQYNLILGYECYGEHLMTSFMAASKGNNWIKKFIDLYENEVFIKENGELNTYPNTYRISDALREENIILDGKYQTIKENGVLFPEIYFSAMEFNTFKDISDSKTYTVHHFKSSWLPWYIRLRRNIKKYLVKKMRWLRILYHFN
ncbi:glycosyltransferase family 32 protein [Trichococcus pasteurii]|uniref:Nucleotide-diphospho-sugar transferases n=1 Tax=Trichococcus pasteurii TaxID=43064 RepID=A0A1W1II76_9LACT|nr:glycosyltransferase [Trichococcus pasteurii]SFF09181.1 Glycosyltransferase sugar-binding region containing DXD motif-containing protein [Trichococcus pasteurii]SLM52747.1 nucleotide-diphospho-sugar transferases [Trichococcus pasteurii]SSB93628.1 nucleotide-diphospho-sugar transferases [Trichococcus pasteurii]